MARSLSLLISPNYNEGGISTDAVAGYTQTLFKVQRRDAEVSGSGKDGDDYITLNVDESATHLNPGDIVFVDVISSGDPTKFIRQRAVAIYGTATLVAINIIDTGVPVLDYQGFINYLPFGDMNLKVEMTPEIGVLPIDTLQFDIVFNHPEFSFDIHQFATFIFVQFPDLKAFKYVAEISAEIVAVPVTGSAIGTYNIDNFKCSLPGGYEFGQNLVGYIPNVIETGNFATDQPNGRLFKGFVPSLYVISDREFLNAQIRRTWRDVNNVNIGSDFEIIDIKYGINFIANSLDWTPPENATAVQIFIVNIGQEIIIDVLRLEVYCPLDNQILIHWQNSLGGLDFWIFDRDQTASISYSDGIEYEKSELVPLQTISGGKHRFNVDQIQGYTVNTRNLTSQQLRQLTTMFQSEFVWLQVSGKLVEIVITGNYNT